MLKIQLCSCAVQTLLKACTMAQQPKQRTRLQPLPSLEQPQPVLVPPPQAPVLPVWFAKGKHQIAMLTNPGETHTKAELQNPDLVNLLTDDIVALLSDQHATKKQTMVRQRVAHLGKPAQSFLVVALHDYKEIDTNSMLWDWHEPKSLPGLAELPDWFSQQKAHYTITRRVDTFDKQDKRTVELIKQLVDTKSVANLTPLESFKIHFNAMARNLLVSLHMLRQARCIHYDIHKGNIGLTLPTTTSTSRNRHMLLFDFGSACALEMLSQRADRSIELESKTIMTKSVHTLVALLVYNKDDPKYSNDIKSYLMKTVVQQLGFDLDMQAVCHVLYELGLTFAGKVDKQEAIKYMTEKFFLWQRRPVGRVDLINKMIKQALVKERKRSYMTGFHKVALEHGLYTFSPPKDCFPWLHDSLSDVPFEEFIRQTVESDGFPGHYYQQPAERWEPEQTQQAGQTDESITLGARTRSPRSPHPPVPSNAMAPPKMSAPARTTGSVDQKVVSEKTTDTEDDETELEQDEQDEQQGQQGQQGQHGQGGQAVPANQADDETATELDEDQPNGADATVGGAAQPNDETEQDDQTVVESNHPAGQANQAGHLYDIPADGWCVYSSYLVAFKHDNHIFHLSKETSPNKQKDFDLQRHAVVQQFVRQLAKRILNNDKLLGMLCKAIRTASTDSSTVSKVHYESDPPQFDTYGYRLDQEAGNDSSWVVRIDRKYKYVKLGSFNPLSYSWSDTAPENAMQHCANFDLADFLHNTWKSLPGVAPRLGKFGSPMMYGDANWFVPIMNEINAGKPELQMDFVIRQDPTGRIEQTKNIVVIKSTDGAHFDSQVGELVADNPVALLGEDMSNVCREYVNASPTKRSQLEKEWDDEWDELADAFNRRQRAKQQHLQYLEGHVDAPDHEFDQHQDADDAHEQPVEANDESGHDEGPRIEADEPKRKSPRSSDAPAQPAGEMYQIRGEILDYLL